MVHCIQKHKICAGDKKLLCGQVDVILTKGFFLDPY